MSQKLDMSRLYGAWTLQALESWRDGALDAYPMGEDGQGRLLITPAARLACFMQRSDWRHAEAGIRPSPERFSSWSGVWRVDGRDLVVSIDLASEPALVGTTQVFAVTFARQTIVLERPEAPNRLVGRNERQVWKKE